MISEDKFSYSRLSTFVQCPMKYKLKYVDGNYEQVDAIHLDLGNILHKVLEIKYRNIIEGKPVNYLLLKEILQHGIAEETDKDKGNFLVGVKDIKNKFGDEKFIEINEKSELSYNDKLEIFYHYLENDSLGYGWRPKAVERHFEFKYEDKILIQGFIDRIDENEKGELRVVDYKSSNKVFRDSDLKTPLQMVVYALACEQMFGKIPIEFQYDMILLGQKQEACSKGYLARGKKKLDKIIDDLELSQNSDIWQPKPTPLCHWCDFSNTNPNIPFYLENTCEYYCLWTPENKTFEKNKEFIEFEFRE